MFLEKRNFFHNEIARLKELKELDVTTGDASDLKEVKFIALRIMTTVLTSPRRLLEAVTKKNSEWMYIGSIQGIWLNWNQPIFQV
jgi:hypothetical protein